MKPRRKLRHARTHGIWWTSLVLPLAAIAVAACGVWGVVNVANSWTENLPSLEKTDAFNFAQQSYMYAADGTTLLAEFQLEKRDPVEQSEISPLVLKGTVATEDERFYEHNGVDLQGIARAIVTNLRGGELEGASTITQQLVRNTVLSEEATDITFERKVREAELAVEMERKYTKDQILNLYLNTINYGDGCYGIEAAAQNYFQKSALDLDYLEAATLVGIPQSPNQLNPKNYPDACRERRNVVLARMLKAEVITQEEYDAGIEAPLEIDPAPDAPYQGIYAYQYFTSYVRDQLLAEGNEYGCSYADLFEGGLTIYTTLDTEMQDKAEQACAEQYASMPSSLDASLVAMNPENGEVLALVGGQDYEFDQWNIATQGGRPAGSTFKMFTLVAAVEAGIDPRTVIDCGDPYTMSDGNKLHNFDSIDYGKRSIASATAVSSNTGFYRLTERLGPDKLIDAAKRMGVTQKLPPYSIITLGTENVTPLQMTAAYNTLATGGIYRKPIVITKIVNRNGDVIYSSENETEGTRVIDEKVAGAVTKVLRRVFETSEGTAYGFGPRTGQPVAGKTGTGSEFRDHWTIGYCPTLTCAVWIGDRDYSSTSPSITASPLWSRFMTSALDGKSVVPFPAVPDPPYSNQKDQKTDTAGEAKPEDTKAPQVVGGSIEQAISKLGDYEIIYSFVDSDQPEGTVLTQTQRNGSVELTVSNGRRSEPAKPQQEPEPTPQPQSPPSDDKPPTEGTSG